MTSNGCPCHPQLQCLRPSTLMTLRMLKIEKNRKNCKTCPAQVSWKVKVKLDPVGSTVRYKMMKLCTGSV